jgi:hypothetical protein
VSEWERMSRTGPMGFSKKKKEEEDALRFGVC